MGNGSKKADPNRLKFKIIILQHKKISLDVTNRLHIDIYNIYFRFSFSCSSFVASDQQLMDSGDNVLYDTGNYGR